MVISFYILSFLLPCSLDFYLWGFSEVGLRVYLFMFCFWDIWKYLSYIFGLEFFVLFCLLLVLKPVLAHIYYKVMKSQRDFFSSFLALQWMLNLRWGKFLLFSGPKHGSYASHVWLIQTQALASGYQGVFLSESLTTLGNLLELQILGPHLRPTESEMLR